MRVLGISAFYHDSAAALIEDGRLVGAAQEERFTRKKHDSGFPTHAVEFCLDTAGIKLADVDYVAFYDKPFLKFERLLETYLAFAPRGFNSFRMAMPLWLKEKLFQKTLLRDEMKHWQPDFDWQKRLLFGEHHQSHAASAFFPSPYEEAAVLCMDGVGEWATTSLGYGKGNSLEMLKELEKERTITEDDRRHAAEKDECLGAAADPAVHSAHHDLVAGGRLQPFGANLADTGCGDPERPCSGRAHPPILGLLRRTLQSRACGNRRQRLVPG